MEFSGTTPIGHFYELYNDLITCRLDIGRFHDERQHRTRFACVYNDRDNHFGLGSNLAVRRPS